MHVDETGRDDAAGPVDDLISGNTGCELARQRGPAARGPHPTPAILRDGDRQQAILLEMGSALGVEIQKRRTVDRHGTIQCVF